MQAKKDKPPKSDDKPTYKAMSKYESTFSR